MAGWLGGHGASRVAALGKGAGSDRSSITVHELCAGGLLTRVAFGFKSPDALIALAMLSVGSLCPLLPGRP